MNKFTKRLQTRASRKGIKVSLQQVRDAYQSVVTDLENPTEEEMNLVLTKLETALPEVGELAITSPVEALEVTEESNADVWEVLEPEENAIAVDHQEPEIETSNKVVQNPSESSLEVQPLEEVTYPDQTEPQRALETTGGLMLQDTDKLSLIQKQARNVEY